MSAAISQPGFVCSLHLMGDEQPVWLAAPDKHSSSFTFNNNEQKRTDENGFFSLSFSGNLARCQNAPLPLCVWRMLPSSSACSFARPGAIADLIFSS